MADDPARHREMDDLLEEASYAITSARTASLSRADVMRAALKRARAAIASAESLAADVVIARKRREEDGS